MNKKEGRHYNKNEKIQRDTLVFITQKLNNFKIKKTDNIFNAKYQEVKRINALLEKTYPFVKFDEDLNKSYMAICVIYHNKNMEDILKKKAKKKELNLLEKREYYKLIEVCFEDSVLTNHDEYGKLKNIFKLIDNLNEIREIVEDDINTFLNIVDDYKHLDSIIEDIYDYRNIQCHAFKEIREKIKFIELNKKRKKLKDNIDSKNTIECKYYEAREILEKALISGDKQYVIIDCMGKKYSEIKKILNGIYDDEYVLRNVGF